MSGLDHVTLHAGHLTLRPARTSDVAAALEMLLDPAVLQWFPGPDVVTPTSVVEWLTNSADWSSGRYAVWMVEGVDGVVGIAMVVNIDREDKEAWIAYRTLPRHRGQGVATAAVDAIVRYAFDVLGLERLTLKHAVANPASCRVAQKTGFALEGTERGGYRDTSGRRWDSHVHGRLREGVILSG
jgi:RimJ/RimL family protein N-acetyltransferase